MSYEQNPKRKAYKRAYGKSPQRLAYLQSERAKELARIRGRKYNSREKTKRQLWESSLKEYGITVNDYERMLVEQSGSCAICNGNRSKVKRRLAVDHCHKTGKVRGLLCHICNSGIGLFGDDQDLVLSAYKYLTKGSKNGQESMA